MEIASRLPSFKRVIIVCIPKAKEQQYPATPLDLNSTLQLLGSPSSPISIRIFRSNMTKSAKKKWIESRIENEFNTLQVHPLNVHAEIQMLIFLEKAVVPGKIFPYIGCSKYNCFLCSTFLGQFDHGKWKTRGCHEKLYSLWTMPDLEGVSEMTINKISEGILETQRKLKEKILQPTLNSIKEVEESSAGMSNNSLTASELCLSHPGAKTYLEKRARNSELETLVESISALEL